MRNVKLSKPCRETANACRASDANDRRNKALYDALVAARDDHILGFTMIGAEAGEAMAVVQTAMLAGLPYAGLRDAILAHPTMAEGLGSPFSNVPPRHLYYCGPTVGHSLQDLT